MLEKIKCPERDSNPRHPDLMEGALTTELPRQPQWSESNISYKRTSITRHLLPGLTDWELLLLIVETCSSDQMYRPYTLYVTRHISNNLFIIREVNSDMPIYVNRTNTGKNQQIVKNRRIRHYFEAYVTAFWRPS